MCQHRMRLAFYLDDGLICGGAERVALRLLRHWRTSGVSVYLISRHSAEGDFYTMPEGVERMAIDWAELGVDKGQQAAGISGTARRFSRFLPFRSFIRLVYEARRLRQVLRRIDADVVVAFLTPANVKLLLAAWGLRCKVIISERNDTRNYHYPLMWQVLRRLLYRHADVVTANMAGTIHDMAAYVPESRLVFVPNPVELPPGNTLACVKRSNRIISVGRLVPYKRHLMLIQSFAALSDEFSAWELDIIGEGSMRTELENAISEFGLCGRVHLHGQQQDISSYYRAGAIFVLPSQVEGTPNTLIEAVGYGLPCIVSDSLPGALEYVEAGITGLTFASESTVELARAMETLARSPELRVALGHAARTKLQAISPDTAYQIWDQVVGIDSNTG